ncbi:hypothetical protein KP509_13G083500 [Ceratopteris richardii]|uniref:Rab-GAP TBC domain-containing protein n=4 Tax=Ceratopteris richardii TaxID=49495 RepID=A0A8T2TFA0_CERRI|nr:hypothetical protein KP509_13G083500 [Ceratopteris richardii]
MLEREFLLRVAVAALHEGLSFVQRFPMSSSSPLRKSPLDTSVAVGVAITAVAGVAVAAAVGGTLIYKRSSPFRRRKKRKNPLSEKQWRDAFDPDVGRLVDQHKILKKIRHGGIDPVIRAEVWLFLLGFYDLDSTQEEREAEKCRKRDVFRDLRAQCDALRANMSESLLRTNGSAKVMEVDSGSSSSSHVEEQQLSRRDSNSFMTVNEESTGEEHGTDEENLKRSPISSTTDNAEPNVGNSKATEDFTTWQRIIRLDAVRMNAEWIPYSPSQANVTEEMAEELAMSVGLKDDDHLEPCRQHHAARLVSILEAYALFDPETGYCQGMSDLLSPFVAQLDEDYQAFWCFVQFMNTARHNFRLDETGIRRQLNKISSIFKVADPHLYSHLESIDAQDCYFVYRMVVVLLRRELTFEQTISLWEVIWAEKRAAEVRHLRNSSWRKSKKKSYIRDDLILFVIAAAVRQKRKIIEKCKGVDEILRECNSMAGNLDLWLLLDDARDLVSALHGRIPD